MSEVETETLDNKSSKIIFWPKAVAIFCVGLLVGVYFYGDQEGKVWLFLNRWGESIALVVVSLWIINKIFEDAGRKTFLRGLDWDQAKDSIIGSLLVKLLLSLILIFGGIVGSLGGVIYHAWLFGSYNCGFFSSYFLIDIPFFLLDFFILFLSMRGLTKIFESVALVLGRLSKDDLDHVNALFDWGSEEEDE